MLNSNFCKMFKNRIKLRKVATIVACLAVTTMFASCDGKNGDDDDGNDGGKIDQKLISHWEFSDTFWWSGYLQYSQTDYYFNKDGTFECEDVHNTHKKMTGKYTTSDGKVYIKDMKIFRALVAGGWNEDLEYCKDNRDVVLEYKFATDAEGEFLQIDILGRKDDAYFEVPSDIKFRKAK